MKHFSLTALLVSLSFTVGCIFASMPARVEKNYLADMTQDESQKIEVIEKAVIDFKTERENSEKLLKGYEYRIRVSKKTLDQFAGEREVLDLKKKMYLETGDPAGLEQNRLAIVEHDRKVALEKALLDYLNQKAEHIEIAGKVLDAKISLKFAERMHLEAVIGRRNQDKILGPQDPAKKEDKARIDIEQYRTYLASQEKRLAELEIDDKKQAAKVEELKKYLATMGYQGNY